MPTKTILLLRHAKSSWDDPAIGDHDRPLNDRGRAAARAMGRFMRDRALIPDAIWCSAATRTRQTLDLWAAAAGLDTTAGDIAVTITEDLYLASPGAMQDLVATTPEAAAAVLVIGHNPGIAQLALRLVAPDDRPAAQATVGKFPTAALAILSVALPHWRDLRAGTGHLLGLESPRDLPA